MEGKVYEKAYCRSPRKLKWMGIIYQVSCIVHGKYALFGPRHNISLILSSFQADSGLIILTPHFPSESYIVSAPYLIPSAFSFETPRSNNYRCETTNPPLSILILQASNVYGTASL